MQSKIVCCEPLGDWGESFLTPYAGFTFGEHVKYTSQYISGCLWPEIVHPSQWAVVVCVERSHFNSITKVCFLCWWKNWSTDSSRRKVWVTSARVGCPRGPRKPKPGSTMLEGQGLVCPVANSLAGCTHKWKMIWVLWVGPSHSGGEAERRREERETQQERAHTPELRRVWGLGRKLELALAGFTCSLIVNNPGL